MKIERAVTRLEVRSAGDENESRAVGLGIVFDTWEEIWPGYREKILPGAVKLAPGVKSYYNHDPSMVLSTVDSTPPLVLRETEKGLEYESPIPPTSYGRDLVVNLARGNVRGSSFAFVVPPDGALLWEDRAGILHREIKSLTVFEIGPVTDPAFVATTASLRSSREAGIEAWRAASKAPQKDEQDNHLDIRRLLRHGELKASI